MTNPHRRLLLEVVEAVGDLVEPAGLFAVDRNQHVGQESEHQKLHRQQH